MNRGTAYQTQVDQTLVQQAESEVERAWDQKRMRVATELRKLRGQREKELGTAHRVREEAREEMETLRLKWETVREKFAEADNRAMQLSASFSSRETRLERTLRETAPPEVKELRRWAEEVAKETRATGLQTTGETEKTLMGPRTRVTHSNRASLTRRLAYLLEVTKVGGLADEIALIPEREKVREACEEVKAGLPELVLEKV